MLGQETTFNESNAGKTKRWSLVDVVKSALCGGGGGGVLHVGFVVSCSGDSSIWPFCVRASGGPTRVHLLRTSLCVHQVLTPVFASCNNQITMLFQ